MKILIVGLPGSGKSTQSQKIAQDLGFCLFQMGDTLRNIAQTGSELGNKIKSIMHSGELVDDPTVAEVMKKAVEESNCESNFVMEGFPRSVEQIKLYDPKFDKVIYLKITEDDLQKRIADRGRSDDTPEAVQKRIEVQKEKMLNLLDFFKKSDSTEVIEIDGTKSINEVFEMIKSYLV